jgi:hypothetical protein
LTQPETLDYTPAALAAPVEHTSSRPAARRT